MVETANGCKYVLRMYKETNRVTYIGESFTIADQQKRARVFLEVLNKISVHIEADNNFVHII